MIFYGWHFENGTGADMQSTTVTVIITVYHKDSCISKNLIVFTCLWLYQWWVMKILIFDVLPFSVADILKLTVVVNNYIGFSFFSVDK